jgi:ATP-dependent Clp protease ATP-binding subunit ClpA
VPRLRRELADFLEQTMQRLPPNARRPPQQTLAFRRVLQTAVVHVQSAGKDEAGVGDMLAALLRETRSHAVELLTAHGVTRLDVLNYISHGVRKGPARETSAGRRAAAAGEHGQEGAGGARPARRLRLQPERARQPASSTRDRPRPRDGACARGAGAGGARTTRSSWASPAWARRRSSKGWPRS